MFVDREEELKRIMNVYKFCLKGLKCGLLIYGWRRVGKTELIKQFLNRVSKGVYINCSWIANPKAFADKVYELLIKYSSKEKANEFIGKIYRLEDFERVLFESLIALVNMIEDEIIPIVLDEFHVFLEKMAKKIARNKGGNSEEVKRNILWLLKDLVEQKNAFIVLLSSIGWEKLQELMLLKKKDSPIIGVFERIEIEPLNIDAGAELASRVNPSIDLDTAKSIAEIAGGIPPIIMTIALTYRTGSVVKHATDLTEKGMFDDFFINIIKFISELSRRDQNIFITVLKHLSKGKKTVSEISKASGLEESAVYEVLKELIKHKIIKKEGRKYEFVYPLMETWFKTTRELSMEKEYESILTFLGIAAESYIRELLKEGIGKKIEIWDDKEGTYLAGTTKSIELEIEKVYTRKETEQLMKHEKNADIIIETTKEIYIIEVKAITKQITKETIKKLAKTVTKLKQEKNLKAKGILIQLGKGGITPTAIAKAVKNNIIMITREGIKLIAKKLKHPLP